MRSLFSFLLVFVWVQPLPAQTETQLEVIPKNTSVEVELLEHISSETLHAGQSVRFKIVRPVAVNGTTVMSAGILVTGEVKAVQPSGAWHKAGSFGIIFKPIQLEDGSTVQLDFPPPKLAGTRRERTGNAIGSGLGLSYFFPLIPFALIRGTKKGKPYEIRAGERYLVYVVSSWPPVHAGTPNTVPQKTTGPQTSPE